VKIEGVFKSEALVEGGRKRLAVRGYCTVERTSSQL